MSVPSTRGPELKLVSLNLSKIGKSELKSFSSLSLLTGWLEGILKSGKLNGSAIQTLHSSLRDAFLALPNDQQKFLLNKLGEVPLQTVFSLSLESDPKIFGHRFFALGQAFLKQGKADLASSIFQSLTSSSTESIHQQAQHQLNIIQGTTPLLHQTEYVFHQSFHSFWHPSPWLGFAVGLPLFKFGKALALPFILSGPGKGLITTQLGATVGSTLFGFSLEAYGFSFASKMGHHWMGTNTDGKLFPTGKEALSSAAMLGPMKLAGGTAAALLGTPGTTALHRFYQTTVQQGATAGGIFVAHGLETFVGLKDSQPLNKTIAETAGLLGTFWVMGQASPWMMGRGTQNYLRDLDNQSKMTLEKGPSFNFNQRKPGLQEALATSGPKGSSPGNKPDHIIYSKNNGKSGDVSESDFQEFNRDTTAESLTRNSIVLLLELHQRLEALQFKVEIKKGKIHPSIYRSVQGSLGSAYLLLGNQEKAVECFQRRDAHDLKDSPSKEWQNENWEEIATRADMDNWREALFDWDNMSSKVDPEIWGSDKADALLYLIRIARSNKENRPINSRSELPTISTLPPLPPPDDSRETPRVIAPPTLRLAPKSLSFGNRLFDVEADRLIFTTYSGGFPNIPHGGLVGLVAQGFLARQLSSNETPFPQRLTVTLKKPIQTGTQYQLSHSENKETPVVEIKSSNQETVATAKFGPLSEETPPTVFDLTSLIKTGEFRCFNSCVVFGAENPHGLKLNVLYRLGEDRKVDKIWTRFKIQHDHDEAGLLKTLLAIDELGWWMGAATIGKMGVTARYDIQSIVPLGEIGKGETLLTVVAEKPQSASKIPISVVNQEGDIIAWGKVTFLANQEAARSGAKDENFDHILKTIAKLSGQEPSPPSDPLASPVTHPIGKRRLIPLSQLRQRVSDATPIPTGDFESGESKSEPKP